MNKKNNVIQVSFKNNIDDTLLSDWLDSKFEQHGNKSNYIKYVLKKKKKKEIEANK